MHHLDLFSGIGGFAIAVDEVWQGATHTFCDNDRFCREVLKKHWPNSYIYEDIRSITTDTQCQGRQGELRSTKRQPGLCSGGRQDENTFLLTGGFPCQPFSAAGRRKGTEDDRHLWPEMLRVIRLTKPTWVIAENVRGLLSIESGMVFEQVCLDLENEGYEVQPIVIPACAVNAPHRRDRVWFIANKRSSGLEEARAEQQTAGIRGGGNEPDPHTASDGLHGTKDTESHRKGNDSDEARENQLFQSEGGDTVWPEVASWDTDWPEVAAELCSVDDGLPTELGGLKLSKAGHRKEQLKAYGNAIVPQVAIEIMKAIKLSNQERGER